VAFSTSACTASREGASTVATLTSYPGVPQDLCRRIGVVQAHVGQQDVLTDANTPCHSLTDPTGSDEDEYACHTDLRTASMSSRTRCGSFSPGMFAAVTSRQAVARPVLPRPAAARGATQVRIWI